MPLVAPFLLIVFGTLFLLNNFGILDWSIWGELWRLWPLIPIAIGLEMVLGAEFFKSEKDTRTATVVPIAFPVIAGSGTLTTIISLKANYGQTTIGQTTILIAILLNLAIVYAVLKSLTLIERILGPAGLIAVRKFFGVVLLAISVKIFASNAPGLI
jgi:multiple antibiotic resistance protein